VEAFVGFFIKCIREKVIGCLVQQELAEGIVKEGKAVRQLTEEQLRFVPKAAANLLRKIPFSHEDWAYGAVNAEGERPGWLLVLVAGASYRRYEPAINEAATASVLKAALPMLPQWLESLTPVNV
jgi:hypothetical protein